MTRFCTAALLLTLTAIIARGDDTKPAARPRRWTLDEAIGQLRLNPRDAYLQYVALQLARRQNKEQNVAQKIAGLLPDAWEERNARVEQVDLFGIFTGALAVQESLQLDTMRGRRPGRAAPLSGPDDPVSNAKRRAAMVKLDGLAGPTIKSHPWERMLAGRKPAVSRLARSVPADFYLVEFHSLARLLEAMDTSDLWATHLYDQAQREARSQRVGDRLRKQLAVQTNRALRPFYDLVVDEVAVTGSDLFVREGSDVTLLFRVKQPEVFKPRMEKFLANARQDNPGAKRSAGNYLGVDYVHVETPDRAVCVYAAYPRPDLHVRSNSEVALKRVLEAVAGKTPDGKAVRALGDTAEFAYIRTIFPAGAREEDGLVYLSDPFIRHLVGPRLKLTERRRMLCYNYLRMVGHAALLYRTEHGRWPDSLQELAQFECTPGTWNEDSLRCPDGGTYELSKDGMTGTCSHHGPAGFLTPCCELPLENVNGEEEDEYKAFLANYNQYWRTYFDPIALRIQITPQRYRLETVVLPLIDNSIYSGLAEALGGKPEALDGLPVPARNIFSVGFRLNKDELLRQSGLLPNQPAEDDGIFAGSRLFGIPGIGAKEVEQLRLGEFLSKGIGNQVGLHVYDTQPTFDFNLPSFLGLFGSEGLRGGRPDGEALLISFLVASLNAPVYAAIPVQDGALVDGFLDRLDRHLAVMARQRERGFLSLNFDFYTLRSKADARQRYRCYSLRFGPVKWRLFWARLGSGLYIASQPFILDDLAKAETARAKAPAPAGPADHGPVAHAMVRVRPQRWKEVLPAFRLGWAETNREACLNNLSPLTSVARAFTGGLGRIDDVERGQLSAHARHYAERLYTEHFFCPEGGEYILTPDGKAVVCSVHGSLAAPRQAEQPAGKSNLGQLLDRFAGMTVALTFLKDGLHAVVTVERR
jgi:hypothetical protein